MVNIIVLSSGCRQRLGRFCLTGKKYCLLGVTLSLSLITFYNYILLMNKFSPLFCVQGFNLQVQIKKADHCGEGPHSFGGPLNFLSGWAHEKTAFQHSTVTQGPILLISTHAPQQIGEKRFFGSQPLTPPPNLHCSEQYVNFDESHTFYTYIVVHVLCAWIRHFYLN